MVLISWLNNLMSLEILIGVLRKYCIQKKIKKRILLFHMFVQIIFHTVTVILEIYVLLIADLYKKITHIYSIFSITSYLFFILSVVIGISYSREFVSFYESVCRISERFEGDKKLINSLKKLYWFSITFILLSLTFAVCRSFFIVKNFDQIYHETYMYYAALIFLSQVVLRFTILFQNLMFFIVIMIVVLLTKSLNSMISTVKESVGSSGISSGDQCSITSEQIQGWIEMYRDLGNSCGKLSLCYGRQVLELFYLSRLIILREI